MSAADQDVDGARLDRDACGCDIVLERPRAAGYLWQRPMAWWQRVLVASNFHTVSCNMDARARLMWKFVRG